MTRLTIIIFTLLANFQAFAFDPDGPPPKKTIERTIRLSTTITIPIIDIGNESNLRQVFRFLELKQSMPIEYGFKIQGERLGEEKLKTSINFKAEEITLLDAMSQIADILECSLVIKPGIIYFEPLNQANQANKAQ